MTRPDLGNAGALQDGGVGSGYRAGVGGGSPFLASALLPSRTSLVLPVLLFLLPSLPGAQKPYSGSFAASHEVGPLGNMGTL